MKDKLNNCFKNLDINDIIKAEDKYIEIATIDKPNKKIKYNKDYSIIVDDVLLALNKILTDDIFLYIENNKDRISRDIYDRDIYPNIYYSNAEVVMISDSYYNDNEEVVYISLSSSVKLIFSPQNKKVYLETISPLGMHFTYNLKTIGEKESIKFLCYIVRNINLFKLKGDDLND